MAAKKLLTGCLVVLILLVAGSVAAWWFVLRPMWHAGVEGAKEWVSAVDLGDDIRNQSPFVAPADGRMSQAQVDAFIRVQTAVAREMGPDLARLAKRTEAAAQARAQGAADLSLGDIGSAYKEMSGLVSRLRAAQAAGVNEAGLSRQEYAWIRRQSLAAMSQLVEVPDLQDMAGAAGLPRFTAPDPDDQAAVDAARHNAALLRPHLPLLEKTLGAMPVAP